ncbi:hypothetical protein OGAPHI_006113 [Ogataea philodendri]|uniref:Uncharacterized protein n=1 Tax=Ogataea philodendri TaxID=1378263 RepID=A0A9P8NZJ6_9ASCO|nr:uncharacterized protein OGAPHI_006113 [Ogataea philodendri]KAH3661934.1 hypothetical protein OGAPHI_006113 [Ogataea philodendri]
MYLHLVGVVHLLAEVEECKTRSVVCVELVDLLQSKTLGFRNERKHKEDTEQRAAKEDKAVGKVDGVGDERREEGNQESPDPVGRGGNGHTFLSDSQWVCFRAHNKDTWTPSGCKEEDVEAREEDHGVSDALAWVDTVGAVVKGLSTNGCENDKTHRHTETTSHQSESSSESVNGDERNKGGGEVDDTQHNGGLERVGQSDRLEDGGTVVEEVVVSGKLLQRLQNHTNHQPVEDLWFSGEQLSPGSGTSSSFNFNRVEDNGGLVLDELGVDVHFVDDGDRSLGVLDSVLLHQITRRFRHEGHTEDHEQSPCETQTVWNSPLSGVIVGVVGTVGCAVSQEDTGGDHQLVAGNKRTTDLFRRGFGNEHWRQDGNRSNSQSGNDTANEELHPRRNRGNLDNDSDNVNHHGQHKTDFSSLDVSESSQSDTSDGTSDVEDGNHQTGTNVGKIVLTATVNLTKPVLEVWHVDETGNGTSIPTKHKTTKCNKRTQQTSTQVLHSALTSRHGRMVFWQGSLVVCVVLIDVFWRRSNRPDVGFLRLLIRV